MKRITLTLAAFLVTAPFAFAQTAATPAAPAEAPAVVIDGQTAFTAECSSCHMAFPARFLPATSWEAMMGDLKNHFGEDASLDATTTAAITEYLVANAGKPGKDTTLADGKPLLRITERRWFVGEHKGEVSAKSMVKAGTMSNCTACHKGAANGNFDDD